MTVSSLQEPARQEGFRRGHEMYPNPPEKVDTPVLGAIIGRRAIYAAAFEAGAAWAEQEAAALLEAARLYRERRAELDEAHEYYARRRAQLHLAQAEHTLIKTARALPPGPGSTGQED